LNFLTKQWMADLARISTPRNVCWNSLTYMNWITLHVTVVDEYALFYCILAYSTILNTNPHSA
jgi:hypothetical protein